MSEYQEIEVNGEILEFPADMSDKQIAAVLEKETATSPLRGYRQGEPVKFGLSDLPGAFGGAAKHFGNLGIGALDITKTAIPAAASRIGAGVLAAPVMFSDPERSQQIFEKYSAAPPLVTEQGRQMAESIAPLAEKVGLGVSDVFGALPGGPVVQAGVQTAAQAPLELLGYRGIGNIAQSAAKSAAKSAARPSPVGLAKPGAFIPEVNDLFNAGRIAFNEARLSGGGVRPESLARAASDVRNIKNDIGLKIDFDPDVHGPAFTVRERLIREFDSGDIDFDRLLTLRELAGDVAGNSDRAISMRGVRMKNAIDDFVNSLGPDDILSGDPVRAAQALASAREFWRDASVARTIEKEMELAANRAGQFSGSGYENALRTQFRQLHARIIKGTERGFRPNEIEAIKSVANGTPFGNAMRWVGKAAPTGIVSGSLAAGAGYLLGGLPLAGAIPVGGALGRLFATRSTINNANRAMEMPLRRSAGLLGQ